MLFSPIMPNSPIEVYELGKARTVPNYAPLTSPPIDVILSGQMTPSLFESIRIFYYSEILSAIYLAHKKTVSIISRSFISKYFML